MNSHCGKCWLSTANVGRR